MVVVALVVLLYLLCGVGLLKALYWAFNKGWTVGPCILFVGSFTGLNLTAQHILYKLY